MDLSLFYALHSLAGLSIWGDALIVFFARWYFYIVLAVFVYAAWQGYRGIASNLYNYAVALIAALIARFGVAEIIRYFYHHDRPYVAIAGLPHLLTDNAYSFPSGHTIFLFALGAVSHFFNKKLAYFLYVSGLVIGLARVAAGVHYPSDIVGGIIIGAATGVCVYLLAERFLTLH